MEGSGIARVDRLTPAEFAERWSASQTPVLITQQAAEWECSSWTLETLTSELAQQQILVDRQGFDMPADNYKGLKDKDRFQYVNNIMINGGVGDAKNQMTWNQYMEVMTKITKEHEKEIMDNSDSKTNRTPAYLLPYLRGYDLCKHCPRLAAQVPTDQFFPLNSIVSKYLFCGAKGTETSLHQDKADNLLAVLKGEKHCLLLSPQHFAQLSCVNSSVMTKYRLGGLMNVVDGPKHIAAGTLAQHPMFSSLPSDAAKICTIREGEMLYIPPQWSHYLHNLQPTISVSSWGKPIQKAPLS